MGRAWPGRDNDARSSDAAVGAAIAGYLRAEAAKAPNTGHLLSQIVARAAQGRNQLSVLDWRGGLGQNQFAARAAAPGVEFEWNVVDVPAYCDYGAVLNPQARFHEDIAALDGRRFDLVFACGTLGFDADWRATFAALARAAGHTFVLVPVLVNAGASFVAANHPPDWRNGAGINTWILGELDLSAAAASAGLKIVGEVTGPPLGMPDAPPGPATARIAAFSRSV
jgi:putative methyltransferase (TIGR04325 family)